MWGRAARITNFCNGLAQDRPLRPLQAQQLQGPGAERVVYPINLNFPEHTDAGLGTSQTDRFPGKNCHPPPSSVPPAIKHRNEPSAAISSQERCLHLSRSQRVLSAVLSAFRSKPWRTATFPSGRGLQEVSCLTWTQARWHRHRWLRLWRHGVKPAAKGPTFLSCFSRDQEAGWKAGPSLELNCDIVHCVSTCAAPWCFLINQPRPQQQGEARSHFCTAFGKNYNPNLEASLWLIRVFTAYLSKIPLPANSSCGTFSLVQSWMGTHPLW